MAASIPIQNALAPRQYGGRLVIQSTPNANGNVFSNMFSSLGNVSGGIFLNHSGKVGLGTSSPSIPVVINPVSGMWTPDPTWQFDEIKNRVRACGEVGADGLVQLIVTYLRGTPNTGEDLESKFRIMLFSLLECLRVDDTKTALYEEILDYFKLSPKDEDLPARREALAAKLEVLAAMADFD